MENKQRSDCWYTQVCQYYPDECDSSCIRYTEMKHLMDSSGLPKSKQKPIKLDACKEDYEAYMRLNEIRLDIDNFVNRGDNLYITSSITGNGKSSWAIKLLTKYFDKVWSGSGFRVRGLFIHVPTFLSQLKNFDNPISDEYKYNIMNCDLVVWDEISTLTSDYDRNQLLLYLEPRIFSNKSNIFTGNITSSYNMEQILGSRLKSRIYDNSEVVEFRGKDRRGYVTDTSTMPK